MSLRQCQPGQRFVPANLGQGHQGYEFEGLHRRRPQSSPFLPGDSLLPVHGWEGDGKEALPGQKIAAFKTAGEWTGEEGRDGRRQHIEEKLLTARIAAIATIESKLKAGSKLWSLALSMVDKTYNW